MTLFTQRPRTVYFIRPIGMRGPIKIGCSCSPDRRRSSLETWSPFPLEIVAEMIGSLDVERRIHSYFRVSHKSREWFEWTSELQRVIDSVIAGTFDPAALPEPVPFRRSSRGNGWTETQKRSASYSHRIRHAQRKTNHLLPDDMSGWPRRLDDPEVRARLEAFIADPKTHGIPREQWLAKLREKQAAQNEAAAARWRKLAEEAERAAA